MTTCGAQGSMDFPYTYTGDRQSAIKCRKLSGTVQLSDPTEYEGGNLILCPEGPEPQYANKAKGGVILFRSHILHEVTPVTKGTRYSLVAWVNGTMLR